MTSADRLYFFASRSILASIGYTFIQSDLTIAASDDSTDTITEKVHYVTRFLPDYFTAETDYFDHRPWASEPFRSDSSEALHIANRFRTFDGYRFWRVTPKSVSAFLSQFPPKLRDGMSEKLKGITLVDAETTVSRLRPLFDNLAGAVDVVAFSPTSGAQIQNWLRKELRDDPRLRFPADLRAALKEGRDGPIVFVDDNAASGVQARAQFLSILNVPREKWPLDCLKKDDLFSPMTVEEINVFRERDVYLYVCAGLPSAGRVINECLERNGFNNFCGLNCAEEIDTHEWSAELRQFLSDVGKHLIGWSRFETQYEALSSSRRAYCKKACLWLWKCRRHGGNKFVCTHCDGNANLVPRPLQGTTVDAATVAHK